ALLFGVSAANAASLLFVGDAGFGGAGSFVLPVPPLLIAGELNSAVALAYGANYVEFEVLPPPSSVSTSVSVTVLASPITATASFPGETYQLGTAPALGNVIGPTGVTGIPVTVG